MNVTYGSNITLSVTATGHLLEFLWQRQDGMSLEGIPRFQGVRTRVLKIRDVRLSDAGVMQCNISNSEGSVVANTTLRVGKVILLL